MEKQVIGEASALQRLLGADKTKVQYFPFILMQCPTFSLENDFSDSCVETDLLTTSPEKGEYNLEKNKPTSS